VPQFISLRRVKRGVKKCYRLNPVVATTGSRNATSLATVGNVTQSEITLII